MTDRYEFSSKTKKDIAARAGYRCSFTDCNAFLIGPNGDTSIELGECAHIYSAAGQGPRGQANLSEEAIKSTEHGIYLCHEHYKLIDSGEVFFTNKRIIFMGSHGNKNIPLTKILDITPFSNGIEIGKDTGKKPFFECSDSEEMGIMLARLLKDC